MRLEVGKIYEGKVTGITKFGAFVDVVEDGKKTTGMVHISEIANTYVSEIKDHVQEGQTVKVKVLSVSEDGKKISMSIKKAAPRPEGASEGQRTGGFRRDGGNRPSPSGTRRQQSQPAEQFVPTRSTLTESGNQSFEDMLSKFKASSEEKIGDMKKAKENKRRSNSHRK